MEYNMSNSPPLIYSIPSLISFLVDSVEQMLSVPRLVSHEVEETQKTSSQYRDYDRRDGEDQVLRRGNRE